MYNYRFGALKCQDASSADGIFLILNSIDFTVIHEACNSKKTLLDCRHSKNKDIIDISSIEYLIYIYVEMYYVSIIKMRTIIN